jgi:hypothetical protein
MEGTDLIDKAIQNNGQLPAGDISLSNQPTFDNKQRYRQRQRHRPSQTSTA